MKMNRRSPFSRPLRDPNHRIGATAVEYMIMIILVALFVMGIVRVFGSTISEKVSYANSGIETMADRGPIGGSGEGVGGEASGSALGGSDSKSASGATKSGKGSGKNTSSQGGSSKKGKGSNKGANSGGKGNKNGKGSAKAGSGKKGKRIKSGASRSQKEEKKDDSGPGINPLVLLIALVLVGLLIYVMVGKKT